MKFWSLLLLAITLSSCTSDDSTTEDAIQNPNTFFPLVADSYWNYENAGIESTKDSIYVESVITVDDKIYTNLDGETPVLGFMARLLTDNLLRVEGSKLLILGDLGVPIEGIPEISLPLQDVILFDTNLDDGTILSTVNSQIEQTVNGIPLVINYTLTTTQGITLVANGGVSATTFSTLALNLEVNALVEIGGITFPVSILAPQDVLTAINIYDTGVGLTNSEVAIEYSLEDFGDIGGELPIPSQFSEMVDSMLTSFQIGE